MSTRVDLDEIEITRTEKVLAVVLAAFILLGAIWIYTNLDDAFASDATYESVLAEHPEDAAAIRARDDAQQAVLVAQQRLQQAQTDLEFDREAYRTAIDAGEPAERLRQEYVAAQAELTRAESDLAAAQSRESATRADADAASARVSDAYRDRLDRGQLWAFLARLVYAAGLLGASFWLLDRLRRTRSRYLPVAFAAVGAATILAFVLAGDYLTGYFDIADLGPLVLSLLGIVLSLACFVALQRYLQRRVPIRRVRKRECPFCGYPVTANEHCEGCGRQVIGECAQCSSPRRVGTSHCGTCGRA
ncbi:MAG: hypothetical protein FJW96_14250 [Actinobacteria bacterium]|nr:hypothetical protein [Actinomycetota bacterium]